MAGRKVRGPEDARACMRAVARSGLTRRDWAVAHGVDARSLHLWDVRLRREADPKPGPTSGSPPPMRALTVPTTPTMPAGPLRFVELVAEAAPVEAATYRLEVGRVCIVLDERFSDAVVARLLRVVTACLA